MTTTSKVLLGIIGAAAAGVVIGLLVAPDKGSETRTKLKKTAGEWADNLSGLWAKGKGEAENIVDEVKSKARQTKESFS